jgi:Zn-dependent protease
MLFRRVTLFRFFGFDIKADASWLFLSVLIGWTLSEKLFPAVMPGAGVNTYQLMALATLLGIIISIIAHEVAHAVIAEYYHMEVTSITLFIFGGVAEMRREPSHPKGEFLMAIAGPIMSIMMGLLFLAWARMGDMALGNTAAYITLDYLGKLNLLIAGFNMIPAFPLDGGRALRAALWQYKRNFVQATRIASDLGQFFAYCLLVYACYEIILADNFVSGMWSGIMAYFMHATSSYAVRETESRSLLGSEKIARFMSTRAATVPPDITLNHFIDEHVSKNHQRHFPVVTGGRLDGLISLQAVLGIDRAKWHWLHVASVMEQISPKNTVAPDDSAADVLDLMKNEGRDTVLVAKDLQYMGIAVHQDMAAYLSITIKIDHNKPVEKSRGI